MNVSTLVDVEGLGLNPTVTPVGIPVAVRATLPVNPPMGVTVMVSVPVPHWVIVSDGSEALIV